MSAWWGQPGDVVAAPLSSRSQEPGPKTLGGAAETGELLVLAQGASGTEVV
jgi:hypothetical protein